MAPKPRSSGSRKFSRAGASNVDEQEIRGLLEASEEPREMAAHPHRRTDINMTTDERRSYVRWWIERSGLTPAQIREVATGIWADRLVDGTRGSLVTAGDDRPTGLRLSERDGLGGVRRSGRFVAAPCTASEADGARTGQAPASVERAARARHRVAPAARKALQFPSQRGRRDFHQPLLLFGETEATAHAGE